MSFSTELSELYYTYFGKKPVVPALPNDDKADFVLKPTIKAIQPSASAEEKYKIDIAKKLTTARTVGGSQLETYDALLGVEIWLPTTLHNLPIGIGDAINRSLSLNYSTIKINSSSTWIKTSLAERRGEVKELYNTNDYKITINGFLIDKDRVFPEAALVALRKLHECGESFDIDNALVKCFLQPEDRVVLESFDLPEVRGGKKHIRPFSMNLLSDSIFTLIAT